MAVNQIKSNIFIHRISQTDSGVFTIKTSNVKNKFRKITIIYKVLNYNHLQGVRQRRFRLTRAVLGHPAGVIVEDVEGLRWSGARWDERLDGGKRGGAGEKTGE